MRVARALDAVIVAIAAFTCFVVLGGVLDTRLGVPPEPIAPPPPAEVTDRDGRLTVVVVSSGAAIARASVRVFWSHRDRYYLAAQATTDPSGRAVFDALPRGSSWIVAEAEGFARASTQLVVGDEARIAEVTLPDAHSTEVTVEDETGAPVDRATVLVHGADPLPHGALTGAEGSTVLERLGPSPWTIKASARGYETATRSGVTEPSVFVLRRLGSLEVTVLTRDGAPAAAASVTIAGSALWPARLAETGADGVARIAGLLSGAYDLRAWRDSDVSATHLGLELQRGEDAKVTLLLEPGRMVTALVTDGDAEGAVVVPNAAVVLVEGGLSSFPILGRTGVNGTVTLGPLPPGPATVGARAEGFVPRAAVAVPAAPVDQVRVPLLRGGTILGEAVDSKGDPVDGASVEIVGTDVDGLPVSETPILISFRDRHFDWALAGPAALLPAGELGVMPGPIPPIPRGAGAGDAEDSRLSTTGAPLAIELPEMDPWVTDREGRFRATPVTPGRVRALVRHPAYVEGVSEPVTLGPGREAKVRVVLLAGGALEGRVIDESGAAVGGARVDLVAVNGTIERTSITADDGTFAFAAVPPEVVLSVARSDDPGRTLLRTTIEVEEGGREVVELTLPAPKAEVSFIVEDEAGDPVEVAQISVLSLDPATPLRRTFFTSADGRAALGDARGLAISVTVDAPGSARFEKTFAEAPEVIAVTLSAGVIVTGEVTAVRGRVAVEGASVTLVRGGERKHALTDARGRYVIRDVTPGSARLDVTHPEWANAAATVEITRTGRADRELELLRIDLAEPANIEGEVVDRAGAPVAGARVAVGVAPAYLPLGAIPPGVAITTSSGHFSLGRVAPGNVTIEAYAVDVGRGRTRVTVDAGGSTRDVRIRLTEPTGEGEPATSGSVAVTLGERGAGDELEVFVAQVAGGSDAERSGIEERDLVLEIDGIEPVSMGDARARLSGPAGSDVVVVVSRGDREVTLRIARERVRR